MNVPSGKKKANLRDVAHHAQVSVATVSRVLNTPDLVTPGTREKVEQSIKELGFFRSAAARAINTGRTKIVGVLVPTLENDIFALTIDALAGRLTDFGFSLVVATTDENPDAEVQKAKELLDIGAEGLFVSGTTHSQELHSVIRHFRVPTIAMSYYDFDFEFPTIGYDNQQATQIAMQHLLDLGHRNIAVVHGPTDHNDRTRARVAGTEMNRDDLALSFLRTELSVAGGCSAVMQARASIETLDAFLCVSDVLAFGVVFELQRQGLVVPDDISVMGVHDLPSAALINPPLSTVHLPARQMGRKAAEDMSNWIENDVRPKPTCFDTRLVARRSTKMK